WRFAPRRARDDLSASKVGARFGDDRLRLADLWLRDRRGGRPGGFHQAGRREGGRRGLDRLGGPLHGPAFPALDDRRLGEHVAAASASRVAKPPSASLRTVFSPMPASM